MGVRQRIGLITFALLGLAAFGCASVPKAANDRTDAAKTSQAPPDMAYIYVYRPSFYAWALRLPDRARREVGR